MLANFILLLIDYALQHRRDAAKAQTRLKDIRQNAM
jgi:hypothetical protein